MKGFWDSSVIVPLCLNAPNSRKVRSFWRSSDERSASWFMPVEVMSAFARAERSGDITNQNRLLAEKLFKSVEAEIALVHSEERIIEIARSFPARYALTALDSLQLAAALIWCNEYPKNKNFVAADSRLLKAAADVGFTVNNLA